MTAPDPNNKIDHDDTAPDEEKTRSGIQSIEVGFRLIEVLTEASNAMMLRDLAHAAGMNPAKAHRYLVSFQRLGLIVQDPVSGRYDLGPFTLRMGLAHLARIDAFKAARFALSELRDAIDQTVGLAVWGNQGPTVVHWLESTFPMRVPLRLGDVMPMLESAAGRLFAAYLPARQTAPLIDAALTALQHASRHHLPATRGAVRCGARRCARTPCGTRGRHGVAVRQCVLHAGVRRDRATRHGAHGARPRKPLRRQLGRTDRHGLAHPRAKALRGSGPCAGARPPALSHKVAARSERRWVRTVEPTFIAM